LEIRFSQFKPAQVPTKPATIMAKISANQSLNIKPAKPNTNALGACCMLIVAAKVATVVMRSLNLDLINAATTGPEAPTNSEINPVINPPVANPARPKTN